MPLWGRGGGGWGVLWGDAVFLTLASAYVSTFCFLFFRFLETFPVFLRCVPATGGFADLLLLTPLGWLGTSTPFFVSFSRAVSFFPLLFGFLYMVTPAA